MGSGGRGRETGKRRIRCSSLEVKGPKPKGWVTKKSVLHREEPLGEGQPSPCVGSSG